jgi:hypothetical protein
MERTKGIPWFALLAFAGAALLVGVALDQVGYVIDGRGRYLPATDSEVYRVDIAGLTVYLPTRFDFGAGDGPTVIAGEVANGLILACLAGAAALGAALARRRPDPEAAALRRMLIVLAAAAAFLALDEVTELSEMLLFNLESLLDTSRPIPDVDTLLYGLAGGAFLFHFRAVLRRSPATLPWIALALVAFATAAILDVALDVGGPLQETLEAAASLSLAIGIGALVVDQLGEPVRPPVAPSA